MGKQARSNLSERAMLVRLKTGSWNGTKVDDNVTYEVQGAHDAGESHGKYTKNLLAPDALKEVNDLRRAAVLYHRSVTLPWQDPWRLLPVDLYDAYKKTMRGIQEQRIEARQTLVDDFDKWIEEARERLGTMFSAEEFPNADQLAERYYIRVIYNPVPDVEHFIADLPDDEREELRDQIQQNINERISGATHSLYVRLRTLIEQAIGQIEKGTFREKLLENMGDLISVLPKLNLTDDPKITDMGKRLSEAITKVSDVKQLRTKSKQHNPDVLDGVKAVATELHHELAGYFGAPPEGDETVTETGESE